MFLAALITVLAADKSDAGARPLGGHQSSITTKSASFNLEMSGATAFTLVKKSLPNSTMKSRSSCVWVRDWRI